MQRINPFLLSFSHKGWLAERAQQQTSDLLLPSISYPQTPVSLLAISRKMYSCSHPFYPLGLKNCYETLKGSSTCLKTRMLVLFLEAECTVNGNSLMFKKQPQFIIPLKCWKSCLCRAVPAAWQPREQSQVEKEKELACPTSSVRRERWKQ